ncbi:MAG: CoA transferase [Longimicrobiales bacterium]
MRPLENIFVVDLSQNLAGPYCTQTLGDLGAEVLKVEPPAGDPARTWGPPFVAGDSPLFLSANRNKQGITLDLKREEDRTILHEHLSRADIFLHSYRAGVIERLGFGVEEMRARYPRLIYCTVSAYGTHGPLHDQPGFDPLMQARSGLISVTGQPGHTARIGTSIVDMGTGLWATIGILAALRERDVTGEGAHVGAALFDTAIAWNAYHIMNYMASGVVPGPVGTAFPTIVPYDTFPTSDGRLLIAAANDGLFARLCRALELHDLLADPRAATNSERLAAKAFVYEQLNAATQRHTMAELEAKLQTAGVPCAPVLDVAQVVVEPQTIATQMLQKMDLPGAPGTTLVAAPIKLNGVRPGIGSAPPRRTTRQ